MTIKRASSLEFNWPIGWTRSREACVIEIASAMAVGSGSIGSLLSLHLPSQHADEGPRGTMFQGSFPMRAVYQVIGQVSLARLRWQPATQCLTLTCHLSLHTLLLFVSCEA